MKNIFSLLIILILFTSPAFAKIFDAKTFTLDNGLQVIVIENDRVPVVTHMIWYKVGAADEPKGQSGIAHYLEHLMFKGTETVAPGEFSRIVRELGGEDNAFTSQDYTAYFQNIASMHLEKMMTMEADRMMNLKVFEEDFQSEKNVVLEERRQRTENSPQALFIEQMRATLHGNHPYANPVIGWMDEIESYEWPDVKAFYNRWYAPNNAILVISGDVTVDEVKEIAMRTYGQIPAKELPPRNRPQTPAAIGQTDMVLYHERVKEPRYQSMQIAPNYKNNKEDAIALDVLMEVLDGGPTTRLYKNLVVDNKIATSVSIYYISSIIDHGTIQAAAIPTQGKTLEDVEAAIENEIQNIRENGITDEELASAIQRLQDSAIFARDSVSGPARIFGFALSTGSEIDDIENWPELVASVTAEDVQRVANEYLDPANPWVRPAVKGYLYPESFKGSAP
ncbi:MAG: pitrilysin family protein [Pseudomonadota bacterium]